MFDWQLIAVALIIAAAAAYVARRGLKRLRSFGGKQNSLAECSTGCGKCGDEQTTRPAPQVVQISRTPPNPTRR
jgi:hypothetical protein